MEIRGTADEYPTRGVARMQFGGAKWTSTAAPLWNAAVVARERQNTLDLSNIAFMTLFEWVGAVAMMERLTTDPSVHALDLDLVGETGSFIPTAEEFIRLEKKNRGKSDARTNEASRVYSLAGFLESLETRNVLNFGPGATKIGYRWLGDEPARLRSFYTRKSGEETVVLPLTRIGSKESCLQFLDETRILRWREAMQERFRNSPLFEFDEVWRVFCHELAVNIWEHAQTTGFLAGRVVFPLDDRSKVRRWCQASYPEVVGRLFPHLKAGFLELCVSDAGQGFLNSLGDSYRAKANLSSKARLRPINVLAFAFDEVGTCKDANDSWATERHALGRILQLVAKYGGALTLRSAGAAISYVGEGGTFERFHNRRGYRPQAGGVFAQELLGSHFQLILPLMPILDPRRRQQRQSVLLSALPAGYHSDAKHAHGHLVPLLEALGFRRQCVDTDELRKFRVSCEKLARKLIRERPAAEAIVLDFSGLEWTAAQFETLLHLLQNVLQQRPVLLVEIDRQLANEVVELDSSRAPTFLERTVADANPSTTGRAFAELSERTFLESFRRIHIPLLGLDIHGRRYIFGLPDRGYEGLLLDLIDKPKSIAELVETTGNEPVIRAIFNNVNPLFRISDGKWRCVWNGETLAVEAARVMSTHFDKVAERCHAWRGRASAPVSSRKSQSHVRLSRDTEDMYFNLPWQDEWVREFFECSRILSRERYADEAGQRLVYRLQQGLQSIGRSLDDVRVLACGSAPSILLAFAIHRCWPSYPRPSIADLGPYIMLSPDADLPFLTAEGAVVVVQDVQDRGRISGGIVKLLRKQDKDVLAIISLVRLVKQSDGQSGDLFEKNAQVTSITEGWLDKDEPVKRHSMIRLMRPDPCHPPIGVSDHKLYWVEPRTLRPFRYSILRGAPRSANPTRRTRMTPFFEPSDEGLLCAGHYTYGEKHYTIAVDVHRALDGTIGDDVANWLADVCSGTPHPKKDWESAAGHGLQGDVTAVLMPLHSRIHYIWPRVSNMLAQRGRRQPMWLLDATLFLGTGPYYRLPLQFEDQLRLALNSVRQNAKNPAAHRTIRILIVDDAISTARTANTILDSLVRALINAYKPLLDAGHPAETLPRVVDWVRYFGVFNQMSTAENNHWHRLTSIGGGFSIPFTFEEFAHVPGVPVFKDVDCPACANLTRFRRLTTTASQQGEFVAGDWFEKRAAELRPTAVDSPGFHFQTHVRLPRRLDLLPLVSPDEFDATANRYRVLHVDVAIWRFYELMYYSRPPSDVLMALCRPNAWAGAGEETFRGEYERFRWAVFEWCLRHWSRIVADSARVRFLAFAMLEVRANTPLVERLFDGLAGHANDRHVQRFVISSLNWLSRLERKQSHFYVREDKRSKQRVRLGRAFTLFLVNIPQTDLRTLEVATDKAGENRANLLDYLGTLAELSSKNDLTFAKNLYLAFTRPIRHADPRWSLRTVAETLFRGRDPDEQAKGGHRLLPKLLTEVSNDPKNEEVRSLLLGSLGQFLAALNDITPYAGELAIGAHGIKDRGEQVLQWLRLDARHPNAEFLPDGLPLLSDDLLPESSFCEQFDQIFHEQVERLRPHFVKHMSDYEITSDALEFAFVPDPDVARSRVLMHIHRLYHFLSNWAIDPIRKFEGKHCSRIEVHRHPSSVGPDRLLFRILTNFADLKTTNELTIHGRNFEAESSTLTMFGVELSEQWVDPLTFGISGAFTAAYDLVVPTGFIQRNTT